MLKNTISLVQQFPDGFQNIVDTENAFAGQGKRLPDKADFYILEQENKRLKEEDECSTNTKIDTDLQGSLKNFTMKESKSINVL